MALNQKLHDGRQQSRTPTLEIECGLILAFVLTLYSGERSRDRPSVSSVLDSAAAVFDINTLSLPCENTIGVSQSSPLKTRGSHSEKSLGSLLRNPETVTKTHSDSPGTKG